MLVLDLIQSAAMILIGMRIGYHIAKSKHNDFPEFTQEKRDVLKPTEGQTIFNSTTNAIQVFENGQWKNLKCFMPKVGRPKSLNS